VGRILLHPLSFYDRSFGTVLAFASVMLYSYESSLTASEIRIRIEDVLVRNGFLLISTRSLDDMHLIQGRILNHEVLLIEFLDPLESNVLIPDQAPYLPHRISVCSLNRGNRLTALLPRHPALQNRIRKVVRQLGRRTPERSDA
jgi:hypothetical protein